MKRRKNKSYPKKKKEGNCLFKFDEEYRVDGFCLYSTLSMEFDCSSLLCEKKEREGQSIDVCRQTKEVTLIDTVFSL